MARKPRPQRPPKHDTLTCPDATAEETATHHTLAPFDRMARQMDAKWGIDRLPELVSVDLAEKFGQTMASLNEAILTRKELPGWVGVGIRAYQALDAYAEEHGAPKADTHLFEYDLDGFKFGVMRDDAAWQAIKVSRPDIQLFTMRQVALALKALQEGTEFLDGIQEHFPEARLTKITTDKPPFDPVKGDPIPF